MCPSKSDTLQPPEALDCSGAGPLRRLEPGRGSENARPRRGDRRGSRHAVPQLGCQDVLPCGIVNPHYAAPPPPAECFHTGAQRIPTKAFQCYDVEHSSPTPPQHLAVCWGLRLKACFLCQPAPHGRMADYPRLQSYHRIHISRLPWPSARNRPGFPCSSLTSLLTGTH